MGNAAIEQHVREMRDPFQVGDLTGDQRTLGYGLTAGRAFPVRDGLIILRRRALYPTPGPWRICGVSKTVDATIRNRAAYVHGADTAWHYIAARAFGNGQVGAWSKPLRLDFDGAGDLITPALPAWPIELSVSPQPAAKMLVTWSYDPWGQGDWPKDFAVYIGLSKAAIIYTTPFATVDFDPTVASYEYTTPFLAIGKKYAFAVRARNSGGVEEQNTYTTEEAIAAGTPPTDATVQLASPRRRGGGVKRR